VAERVGDRLCAVADADLREEVVDVLFTFAGLTTRRSAISAFVSPSAISASTSASRGVSPSGSTGPSGAASSGSASAADADHTVRGTTGVRPAVPVAR
jgi:hypothetical protein